MFSQITSQIGYKLNDVLEKWADSLESSNDDYLHVDGEEGDFGTIKYFAVRDGEKVHVLTEYINPGDDRELRITAEGIGLVEREAMRFITAGFTGLLEYYEDTGRVGSVISGEVAAARLADKLAEEANK